MNPSPSPTILLTGWGVPIARLDALKNCLTERLGDAPLPFDMADIGTSPSTFPLPDNEPSPYARALSEVLMADRRPAVVIGWSTGALIALETASFWPAQIEKLVLISPTACFCARENYPHGTNTAEFRLMISGMKKKMRRNRVLEDFFIRLAFPKKPSAESLQAQVSDALSQGDDALFSGLAYLLHTDLRARMTLIPQPTLVIHGGKDQIIPISGANWICDNLAHALLISEEEEGHHLPGTIPDVIARNAQEFILTRQ